MVAARAGVTFWLDDDHLAYRAPQGEMTVELREEIIRHKLELIEILRKNRADAAVPVAQGALAEETEFPLASGQERLWLIEHRAGPSPLHNVHFRLLWK